MLLVEDPFERRGIGLHEQQIHQRVQRIVQFACGVVVTRVPRLEHARYRPRRKVAHRGDEADAAEGIGLFHRETKYFTPLQSAAVSALREAAQQRRTKPAKP